MEVFVSQVKLTFWLRFLQQKRRRLQYLADILFPVVFLLLVLVVQKYATVNQMEPVKLPKLENICPQMFKNGQIVIGYAPSNGFTDGIMQNVKELNQIPEGVNATMKIIGFEDVSLLEKDGLENPGKICMQLLFDPVYGTTLSYTIRVNNSLGNLLSPFDYANTGFLSIQALVDQASDRYFVARYKRAGVIPYLNTGSLNPLNVTVSTEILTSFSASQSTMVGILYFGAFIRLFQVLLVNLTMEKEDKFLETMTVMGLRMGAFWAGNFLFGSFYALFSVLLVLSLVYGFGIFVSTSFSLLFVFFSLFVISLIALAIFVSTLIDKVKSANQIFSIFTIIVVMLYFSGNILVFESHPILGHVFSIVSPVSFAQGTYILTNAEASGYSISWFDLFDTCASLSSSPTSSHCYNFPFGYTLLWLIADIFIYLFLSSLSLYDNYMNDVEIVSLDSGSYVTLLPEVKFSANSAEKESSIFGSLIQWFKDGEQNESSTSSTFNSNNYLKSLFFSDLNEEFFQNEPAIEDHTANVVQAGLRVLNSCITLSDTSSSNKWVCINLGIIFTDILSLIKTKEFSYSFSYPAPPGITPHFLNYFLSVANRIGFFIEFDSQENFTVTISEKLKNLINLNAYIFALRTSFFLNSKGLSVPENIASILLMKKAPEKVRPASAVSVSSSAKFSRRQYSISRIFSSPKSLPKMFICADGEAINLNSEHSFENLLVNVQKEPPRNFLSRRAKLFSLRPRAFSLSLDYTSDNYLAFYSKSAEEVYVKNPKSCSVTVAKRSRFPLSSNILPGLNRVFEVPKNSNSPFVLPSLVNEKLSQELPPLTLKASVTRTSNARSLSSVASPLLDLKSPFKHESRRPRNALPHVAEEYCEEDIEKSHKKESNNFDTIEDPVAPFVENSAPLSDESELSGFSAPNETPQYQVKSETNLRRLSDTPKSIRGVSISKLTPNLTKLRSTTIKRTSIASTPDKLASENTSPQFCAAPGSYVPRINLHDMSTETVNMLEQQEFENYVVQRVYERQIGNDIPEKIRKMSVYHESVVEMSNEENPSRTVVPVISIENVSKSFNSELSWWQIILMWIFHWFLDIPKPQKLVIDNFSISINDEIVCLLGHNGAGKTTLISILVGLLKPSKARNLSILNSDLLKPSNKKYSGIGICPQKDLLFKILTPKEHLQLYCSLKGLPEDQIDHEVEFRLEQVGLKSKADSLVKTLSGGMKRRLSIAIAFCGNSKLVVLDEPSNGLDVYHKQKMWDVINSHRGSGKTVILTTHNMEEAEILADRIAIISSGKLKCFGTSAYLKNVLKCGYQLVCSASIRSNGFSELKQIMHSKFLGSLLKIDENPDQIVFSLPNTATSSTMPNFLKFLEDSISRHEFKLNVASYGLHLLALEEVFLSTFNSELARKKQAQLLWEIEAVSGMVLKLIEKKQSSNVEIDTEIIGDLVKVCVKKFLKKKAEKTFVKK